MSEMKMTEEQAAMLDACLAQSRAWLTARGSANHKLLTEWEQAGWSKETPLPDGVSHLTSVVAYRITDAGRAALAAEDER